MSKINIKHSNIFVLDGVAVLETFIFSPRYLHRVNRSWAATIIPGKTWVYSKGVDIVGATVRLFVAVINVAYENSRQASAPLFTTLASIQCLEKNHK